MPDTVQTKDTNTVSLDEIEAKNQPFRNLPEPTPRDSRFEHNTLNNTNVNTNLFGEVTKPEPNTKKNEKFTVQKSIDMIRNLVEELNRHGVNADIDEMNFSKSYQIIIKLDKTAE